MDYKQASNILKVYGILDYAEIIRRYIDVTSFLEGPSGYPVEIIFSADNSTEPPIITVRIFEGHREVFYTGTDQNTTLKQFDDGCHDLTDAVEVCLNACKEQKSYEEVLKEKKGRTMPDIPDDNEPF